MIFFLYVLFQALKTIAIAAFWALVICLVAAFGIVVFAYDGARDIYAALRPHTQEADQDVERL